MTDPSILVSIFIPLVFMIGVGIYIIKKIANERLVVFKEILKVLKEIRDK